MLIAEGDVDADNFYIVQGGKYEVTLLRRPGDVVHTYRNPGESFGELALLYNCPYAKRPRTLEETSRPQAGLLLTRLSLTLDRRAATVRCTRGGTLWALDRATFRDVLCGSKVDETQATAAFLGARDVYLLWPSCIHTVAFLGAASPLSRPTCHAMPCPYPPLTPRCLRLLRRGAPLLITHARADLAARVRGAISALLTMAMRCCTWSYSYYTCYGYTYYGILTTALY